MSIKKERNSGFLSILRGDFIAHKNNRRYLPFILMLVVFILFNISMSFRAEGLLRKAILLEEENADLRLVYITTKTDLMSMYKRSVIEEIVLESGLKTSLDPPLIIEKFNEKKKN